jgi:NADPH:quinone reductase-like Zn-dependent oxidoreductase
LSVCIPHVAAKDSPEYQPAKWLVRLVDSQFCENVRARYGRSCEFFDYDLVLDVAGSRPWRRVKRVLNPEARLVIVGGETGGRWLGGTDRQLRALILSRFVGQKLGTFVSSENNEDLRVLKELIESRQLTPAIDRTYPLSEVPAAVRYMLDGYARGKVVISVGDASGD